MTPNELEWPFYVKFHFRSGRPYVQSSKAQVHTLVLNAGDL